MKKYVATLWAICLLAGCAAAPPAPSGDDPSPRATATVTPTPTATPTPTPTPTPVPVDTTIGLRRPSFPDRPRPTLTPEQEATYGACLETSVSNWSKGDCATLLQEELIRLGYLEGEPEKRIGVAAMNALLRYQRSREVAADGNAGPQTWYALASGRPARDDALPRECTEIPGVVLCVDQAHSTLKFVRDGVVERTFEVRLGGWNSDAKTKKWRVFPTANGLWRVYNKHRNPSSPTYGEGVMPYSVMFDPNMYVHYSADFAKRGHTRSSHGCVNIASKEDAQWIFDNTPIEARVWVW
ncbi:MAG: L,D-transpeptidase family protein [Propionibacteriaceae bacterium]|nr:L,D-transpeptidase family protein [Propionibacteriaceae bacterium]